MKNKKYIGKTVLVDLSVFSHDNTLLETHQYFGEIISVGDVISIKTDDGEINTLPPDVKSLKKAPKGIYTLKSNGKQIENPDFISRWSITRPEN